MGGVGHEKVSVIMEIFKGSNIVEVGKNGVCGSDVGRMGQEKDTL